MKLSTVALIEFELAPQKRPTGRFFVQARLPSDGPMHPYGQWSLGVVPVGRVGDLGLIAKIDFVAPDAPRDQLRTGVVLELFRGTERVGRARIADAPAAHGADRDFLWSAVEPPREAAA